MRLKWLHIFKNFKYLGHLSKTSTNATHRLIKVKHPWNFIKINLATIWAPTKCVLSLSAAYGSFCIGYALTYPRGWQLSDHCIYITGITRMIRTLYNAFIVFLVYKYYFWGVIKPESSEKWKFSIINEERELTEEEMRYNMIWHDFLEICCKRLINVILTNGGLYVKFGQGLATYSSMLPPQVGSALKPLLENIFERQSGEVEHMFVQDFGDEPTNLFAEFNHEPIAGASIAQVFVGKTFEGSKVAIKVQYHDINKRFRTDKWTILLVTKIFAHFNSDFPIIKFVPHIFDALEKELDFIKEGKNAKKCSDNLKFLNFLVVPKVHEKLSSKRILTMDWADGISLVDVHKVKAAGFNPTEVMYKVIRIFAEQIFKTGFIHCDPHPGNIMVRKNIVSGKTEIVLIDHGLYEQLPSNYREAFARFWHSVIIENDDEVQQSGQVLGFKYPDILATMLFFKPYGKLKAMYSQFGGAKGDKRGNNLSEITDNEKEQLVQLRHMGHQTIDNMPKQLALVFRNLRLIQGINLSFGVPVNRIRVMAQTAVRNSTFNVGVIHALRIRLKFEWYFFVLDLRNRVFALGLWFYRIFFATQETKEQLTNMTLFLQA